jgi:hypothetical protein
MRSPHPSNRTRFGTLSRRRLAAGAVAGTMILAACGGGGDSDQGASNAQPADALPEVDAAATDGADAAEASPAADATPAAAGDGFVDLFGTDVVDGANIESNLLPDVVVNDLTNGREVNFRNLVPQEKPILLWMYAPH